MRRKVIIIGAVLALIAACTSDGDEKPPPPKLPPNPRPGQAVIIAGDPDIHRDPRDGEYALRTSATTHGGLAVADDGTVYFQASVLQQGRTARLNRDGRITLMELGNAPTQLAISGGHLWLMGANNGLSLTRADLSSRQEKVYIGWQSALARNKLEVVDESKRVITPQARGRLDEYWSGSKLGIRGDGIPIIVSRRGELFEVIAEGVLRRWAPRGYVAALRRISEGQELRPIDVVTDGHGGLLVLSRFGIARLPPGKSANGVRFPDKLVRNSPWSTLTQLDDGSVLLLGSTTTPKPTPWPALIKPNGDLELLAWGSFKDCDEFDGSLAAIGSAFPGGLARKPDGSFILSDKDCGKVYNFRLPASLSGRPYRG